MPVMSSPGPWLLAAVTAAAVLVVYLYQGLTYRRFQQFADLPQVKSSLLLGHLGVVAEAMKTTSNLDDVLGALRKSAGNPDVLLVDIRPISHPLLVVSTHAVAEQISKQTKVHPYSVPKSPAMAFLTPLVGHGSIILLSGPKWRELRKSFNPGFAPQHLMSLLPLITDKTKPFIEHLDGFVASGETFTLEPLLTSLTFDIIGAVTMNIDFGAQLPLSQQSALVQMYRDLLFTYYGDDGSKTWWNSPITILKRNYHARRVDEAMGEYVRNKYERDLRPTITVTDADSTAAATTSPSGKDRSVLALSLQDKPHLTPALVQSTVDQLKTFMFAGHDTTSILLQWAVHEIYRHPRVLAALRAELDDVFGSESESDDNWDPRTVRDVLSGPRGFDVIRARMPYTSAVVKETLRLHPPAATGRLSPPGSGCKVKLADGRSVCVDGLVLYSCQEHIHRDEEVYGDTAGDFVPERWLGNVDTWQEGDGEGQEAAGGEKKPPTTTTTAAPSGDEIPAAAWRPFERGPRNCIGQELANIEARIILACIVRKYDFVKAGTGEATLGGDGKPVVDEKGKYVSETDLYAIKQVTARPNDGIQVKVKLRGEAFA